MQAYIESNGKKEELTLIGQSSNIFDPNTRNPRFKVTNSGRLIDLNQINCYGLTLVISVEGESYLRGLGLV